MAKFNVGDRVCYNRTFLRSIGAITGELPAARGIVQEIKNLGSTQLATVQWNNEAVPSKVALPNLAKITDKMGIIDQY